MQRSLRRQHRLLKKSYRTTGSSFRTNVWAKWRQLTLIRRFAINWWAVMLVAGVGLVWQVHRLSVMGAVLQPMSGGVYSEGVVGAIKTINPILPDNSASADATSLVFNGLTRFDGRGQLRADLAQSWGVSPDGKTYTFQLRHGVKWHDNVPFTSQDVAFTLTAIQNPDTRSPLAPSWQKVTVGTPDDYTVVFTLPKPYTPFVNATTVGILPRHLLENTDPRTLRVSTFNQHPIGTGPFEIDQLDAAGNQVMLKANPDYFAGKPLLSGVILRWYDSAAEVFTAYSHRQVLGMGRVQPDQTGAAAKLGTVKQYEAGVPDQVAVFFHTSEGLLADKGVRTALAQATDRQAIITDQFSGQGSALTIPVVAPGLNLNGVAHQPAFNLAAAATALEAAGWQPGPDGERAKNGTKLEFKIATQTGSKYGDVARELAKQWALVGARVTVTEMAATILQQSYIRPRHYDALLYGINIGADPDVYAYWHSSQATDPGLNLSSYKSAPADLALEGGRVVRDPQTRSAKYRSFIQNWVGDNPAVMLYTPTYVYGVDQSVHGIDVRRLITPSDRFDGIQNWYVRARAVAK